VLAMVSVIGANLMRDRASAGAGEDAGALRHLGNAPAFSLIDQNERPVTLESLKGKPFIADFIFTKCAGPCPVMSATMKTLRKKVPADVNFVSFSVDPKQDRPAVLREYAAIFSTDDARWHFLTVAKPEDAAAMYTLARGMLLTATPADARNPILHDKHFVLVDSAGEIRGFYDSDDKSQMDQLITDASALLHEPPAAGTK